MKIAIPIYLVVLVYVLGLCLWTFHQSAAFYRYDDAFRSADRRGDREAARAALADEDCTYNHVHELNPRNWVRYWNDPHRGPCGR